jgi:phosphatidylglycerol lysyltransferase
MALVRDHGRAAASFQVLTSGLKYWFTHDACVAYADVGAAWVAVGGPIASIERELAVSEQFAREARGQGKRVRFFALEHALPSSCSLTALQIGEQPVWNPQVWPHTLKKKLRAQLRRGWAKGALSVRLASPRELADAQSATRCGLDALIGRWLDSRKMAPLEFMVRLNPYALAEQRRCFVAEHQGRLVGALIAMPVYARNGWFLETMLRHPAAPNGSVELMFDFAMRSFQSEGSEYVSFGLCPLAGCSGRGLAWFRRYARFLYNFDGLRSFKAKLGPTLWQPVYLAYPQGDHALLAVTDALRAFLPGGLLRFAWSTLRQWAGALPAQSSVGWRRRTPTALELASGSS